MHATVHGRNLNIRLTHRRFQEREMTQSNQLTYTQVHEHTYTDTHTDTQKEKDRDEETREESFERGPNTVATHWSLRAARVFTQAEKRRDPSSAN